MAMFGCGCGGGGLGWMDGCIEYVCVFWCRSRRAAGRGERGVIVLFKKGDSALAKRDGIDGASSTLSALRMGGGCGGCGVWWTGGC